MPRIIEYEWMSVDTWRGLHAEHCAVAARGCVDVLFLGDSLTQGWAGTQAWNQYFGHLRTANFGIGGDATQHLLWRLQNGEVGALQPCVVVLVIGVNNLGREQHTPVQTAAGVKTVVDYLRHVFPSAKVLLQAILPADESAASDFRRRIMLTNGLLVEAQDGRVVFFEDFGGRLLETDGRLAPAVSPDFLHLSEEGYRRWAEALAPVVTRLLGRE